jgi:hypothetical protein
MPEEVVTSEAANTATTATATPTKPAFDSPPPAPVAERREFDPRARLHEIALALVKTRDRRLLLEYLQLRRAVR